MKMINRVFFSSEAEAIEEGYRPCGHCLEEKYKEWQMQKTSSAAIANCGDTDRITDGGI